MRQVVGISDMLVSNKPDDVLVTYSLGSCIGIVIWDPQVRVGGLLHYMLPDSRIGRQRGIDNPYMFADTGIPAFFRESYNLGALKSRLVVKAVGGSQLLDSVGIFNIGSRNYQVMRQIFDRNNVKISREDIGGTVNRTVSLTIGTGRTLLKISGRGEIEL